MGGIKNFKPRKSGRIKSGAYVVKNIGKYIGDLNKVYYRSGLELKLFIEIDNDPKVVRWEAEPNNLKVKYISPVDRKEHTYYPDVYCEKIVKDSLVKFLIEIKPKKFVLEPKRPNKTGDQKVDAKRNNRYWALKRRHAVIHAKRKSAENLAKRRGMKYIFITEDYINRKKD